MRALRGWLLARDPGLLATRRAARTAIVMPAMFALGWQVIGNPTVATFAAFGSFAMLLLADFRRKCRRTVGRAGRPDRCGVCAHLPGHARVDPRPWLAAVAMLVVGFVAGLEGIRVHDLRHADASWLLAGGADLETVMDRLGHTQIRNYQEYPTPSRRRRQSPPRPSNAPETYTGPSNLLTRTATAGFTLDKSRARQKLRCPVGRSAHADADYRHRQCTTEQIRHLCAAHGGTEPSVRASQPHEDASLGCRRRHPCRSGLRVFVARSGTTLQSTDARSCAEVIEMAGIQYVGGRQSDSVLPLTGGPLPAKRLGCDDAGGATPAPRRSGEWGSSLASSVERWSGSGSRYGSPSPDGSSGDRPGRSAREARRLGRRTLPGSRRLPSGTCRSAVCYDGAVLGTTIDTIEDLGLPFDSIHACSSASAGCASWSVDRSRPCWRADPRSRP